MLELDITRESEITKIMLEDRDIQDYVRVRDNYIFRDIQDYVRDNYIFRDIQDYVRVRITKIMLELER